MSKYNNRKIIIDNIKFDSEMEGNRYLQLKLLERANKITNLQLQPRFLLQESFKKNGKAYRKMEYIADFQYEENGQTVVEDVKGKETEVFKIKRKMFEYQYKNLNLKIVTKNDI